MLCGVGSLSVWCKQSAPSLAISAGLGWLGAPAHSDHKGTCMHQRMLAANATTAAVDEVRTVCSPSPDSLAQLTKPSLLSITCTVVWCTKHLAALQLDRPACCMHVSIGVLNRAAISSQRRMQPAAGIGVMNWQAAGRCGFKLSERSRLWRVRPSRSRGFAAWLAICAALVLTQHGQLTWRQRLPDACLTPCNTGLLSLRRSSEHLAS